MRNPATVDAHVYMRPSPAAVAKLVDSHGAEAAAARWYWVDKRSLDALAQVWSRATLLVLWHDLAGRD